MINRTTPFLSCPPNIASYKSLFNLPFDFLLCVSVYIPEAQTLQEGWRLKNTSLHMFGSFINTIILMTYKHGQMSDLKVKIINKNIPPNS